MRYSVPQHLALAALVLAAIRPAGAQSLTFAGNSQHTGQYDVQAQPLNQIHWSFSIDLNNAPGNSHYGAPLITPANTVIAPVRISTGFRIDSFAGATGARKYTLTNDYVLPRHDWLPTYQPVITAAGPNARLYYPGAGGTVYYIDNPDSDTPAAPVQQCFFTDMDNYRSNAALFKATVFINTPLTADTNGTIYFGFRVFTNGITPPFTTTNGGFARIDPQGNATFVLAGAAAGDPVINNDSHNSAPALSLDGSTLYVVVKNFTNTGYAYLLGLDSATLATRYRVRLQVALGTGPSVLDDSTASPMIGPDGDVFFGVFGGGSIGFMAHYSADLSITKAPGGFGWDSTPAIVPTNMVPSYTGTSPYLLFLKYNNYAGGGNGINRIALVDPNADQVWNAFGSPQPEMRELCTVIGCTPDNQGASVPYAVREWCINAAAVNPATESIFVPSEDGRIYRWNVALNSLTETLRLGSGIGEPYVPTQVGPDGQVYSLNGGKLFALGGYTNLFVGVYSSSPDLRSLVVGQPVTFTAVVTNLDPAGLMPTGTVTFLDVTYHSYTPVTNTLAANVALDQGMAAVTTTNLTAGVSYLGNHFITASYSGDADFQPGSATLVQKVHAHATSLTVASRAASTNSPLTLTATAASDPPGGGIPTGMVSFWAGPNLLGQAPLGTNGVVTYTTQGPADSNLVSAVYCSDTVFAWSSFDQVPSPPNLLSPTLLSDIGFQFSFSNIVGAPFTVFGSVDPSLPLSNWNVLGPATEILPGLFQFTDPNATNNPLQFYRVRSP